LEILLLYYLGTMSLLLLLLQMKVWVTPSAMSGLQQPSVLTVSHGSFPLSQKVGCWRQMELLLLLLQLVEQGQQQQLWKRVVAAAAGDLVNWSKRDQERHGREDIVQQQAEVRDPDPCLRLPSRPSQEPL
jgi:hypothetical protein